MRLTLLHLLLIHEIGTGEGFLDWRGILRLHWLWRLTCLLEDHHAAGDAWTGLLESGKRRRGTAF